ELDPVPRVILEPGLGLFGLGRSAKDAAVAADLAESWVATVTDAEAVGTFESLSEAELFEMEYWSLEQAKLGSAVEKPLAGPVAQNAVRIMRTQGTGGCLLFNVSRQAVSPGPNAGPYGLPKAATLFLMRQYALEYGADGIRANAVNADGIRGGLLTPEFIKERADAYRISEADYMARNLLGREVTAED